MSIIDLNQRGKLEKLIAGALKDTIHSHGAITTEWIGSASKRVISAIKVYNKQIGNK